VSDDHGLVDKSGLSIRKGRISPALRTAIILIVEQGLTLKDAAARTGYKPESLAKAMCKPHVRAFRASVKDAWWKSKTDRAYVDLAELATSAMSEDVRLKAIKEVIAIDREVQRAMPEQARQLVQIVTQSVQIAADPLTQRAGGVIEAKPFQLPSPALSNSEAVGWPESDDDDA